jgi:hypothetical protein
MFAARALLATYPDALFVQTHRDPIEAISSVSSLVAILRGIFSESIDAKQIGRDAADYWAEALKTFMNERDRLPPERVCDLDYNDVRRDPIDAVRRIYNQFGWQFPDETARRMRTVLTNQPRNKHRAHRYHPSQFGLGSDARFRSYCERFGLNRPIRSTVVAGVSPA